MQFDAARAALVVSFSAALNVQVREDSERPVRLVDGGTEFSFRTLSGLGIFCREAAESGDAERLGVVAEWCDGPGLDWWWSFRTGQGVEVDHAGVPVESPAPSDGLDGSHSVRSAARSGRGSLPGAVRVTDELRDALRRAHEADLASDETSAATLATMAHAGWLVATGWLRPRGRSTRTFLYGTTIAGEEAYGALCAS